MIEFEIKPEYYKQIHNAINAVSNECRLNFTKSSISTNLVNPINTMMGIIDIPKNTFESFKVTKSETIGFELNLFKEKTKKKPIQSMFLNSKVNHKFKIIHENGITIENVLTTAFIQHDIFKDKVSLIDVNNIRKEPIVPALELPCIFGLPVSTLRKLIKRGEYVRFITKSDGNLICNGEPDWNTTPILVNSNAEANSMYDMDYLKGIISAIPRNVNCVKFTMGIDFPCTIEFNICDGKVPVKYLLAPRIESE